MRDPQRELEHLRAYFTGEPDAAMSCLSGSEGAGWKRAPAMEERATLRPYLHYVLDEWFEQQIKPCLKGAAYLIR